MTERQYIKQNKEKILSLSYELYLLNEITEAELNNIYYIHFIKNN